MKLRRISPVIGQLVLIVLLLSGLVAAQSEEPKRQRRAPLGAAEIDDITRLLMLEDTRAFDEAALARTLKSSHPEVRRRAALAIGRIANRAGLPLLTAARGDANAEVAATVVFSAGQLRDAAAVPWLSELLTAPKTSLVLAREAAIALGKIQAPESRAALAGYLLKAPLSANPSVVGEALLSIGRFTGREDLAPMLRWTSAKDTGVRWRAAWALMRTRDLAAVPALLQLVKDPSADVRFWAVRGLAVPAGPQAPPAGEFDRVQASALLRQLVRDPDRRVRTDALRALATHQDDASFAIVLEALDSPDTWLSVLAVESMDRFQSRADVVVSPPRRGVRAGPAAVGAHDGAGAAGDAGAGEGDRARNRTRA